MHSANDILVNSSLVVIGLSSIVAFFWEKFASFIHSGGERTSEHVVLKKSDLIADMIGIAVLSSIYGAVTGANLIAIICFSLVNTAFAGLACILGMEISGKRTQAYPSHRNLIRVLALETVGLGIIVCLRFWAVQEFVHAETHHQLAAHTYNPIRLALDVVGLAVCFVASAAIVSYIKDMPGLANENANKNLRIYAVLTMLGLAAGPIVLYGYVIVAIFFAVQILSYGKQAKNAEAKVFVETIGKYLVAATTVISLICLIILFIVIKAVFDAHRS